MLVIGDAPSPADDTVGKPFAGDVFEFAETMMDVASLPAERAYTTVVACYPEDEKGRYRDPTRSEIIRCWPRLKNLLEILKPKIIVTAGVIASKTMDLVGDDLVIDGFKPIRTDIASIAMIMRSGGEDSVSYSYSVVALKNASQMLQWRERLNG